jgi:1-acyl-sn-glycerol-3-phosphate acyltransferase
MIEQLETTKDTISEIHNKYLAIFRLSLCVIWVLFFVPTYYVFFYFKKIHICRHYAVIHWKIIRFILGIRLIIKGTAHIEKPMFYVANHCSYLDIIILGSLLPCAFIAKEEIRHWPIFGFIAKIGRTIFIDRKRAHSTEHRNKILDSLSHPDPESMLMFPEGTSNNGNCVLPFKSSLFSTASIRLPSGEAMKIQPISIAYTKLDGLPIGRHWRAFYAWYGDMTLGKHLWTLTGLGKVTAEVVFHPVINFDMFKNRKEVSEHCETLIRQTVMLANSGKNV